MISVSVTGPDILVHRLDMANSKSKFEVVQSLGNASISETAGAAGKGYATS